MKNLSAEDIVALAMTTAIKIAKETDPEELNIVSDFFSLVGSGLQLIADRREIANDK